MLVICPTAVSGLAAMMSDSWAMLNWPVCHEYVGELMSYGTPFGSTSGFPRMYGRALPGSPALVTKTYSLFSVAPPPVVKKYAAIGFPLYVRTWFAVAATALSVVPYSC